MSAEQMARNIDAAIAYIESGEVLKDGEIAGMDIVALITDRVVQTGRDDIGQPFTPYSTKPLPGFYFYGKSRNAGADARVKKAIKDSKEGISYKDFRELNNLKTDKKNFEFTGAMWRGFSVKAAEYSGNVLTLTLGGTTQDSARKLFWAMEQEGKRVNLPSEDEILLVQQTFFRRVAERIGDARGI